MTDVNSSIDYEDKIISDEVRRKMDTAVKEAEAKGIEVESEYYTGSDLDKMKEFARLNNIGVITGPFADFGRGVNIPRTPTLFNLFTMEEELSHNEEPEGPDINEGKFKANPARVLRTIKGRYDEEKRAKKEALQKTGGLLPKGQRTVELTKNTYSEMFNEAIDNYVEKTGDIETKKVLLNDYPELKNVKKVIYPEGNLPFSKGGAVSMKEQMEMFEDGGLMQEGGTVDPVSGNDVPVGSTQEEVRDDIPAQLSEGEFVFPADVVRYFGLERLMEMRQQAKSGLQRMEDMGQMGNSEEATLPDDIPFDINDLDIEDEDEYNNELEMQVGGFVQPSQFQNYQPQYTPYQAPVMPTTYQPAQQQAVPTLQQPAVLPEFKQFVAPPQGMAPENREYINPTTGERRVFTFINNQPTIPIPEGFVLSSEYKEPERVTTTPTVGQTSVVQDRGGRDDSINVGGRTAAEIQQGVSEVKDRYSITGSRGFDLIQALPFGSAIKNIFGVEGPVIGKKAPGDITGPKDQLRMEYEKVLGTGITGYVGYEKGDLDPVTGGVFDKRGRSVNEDGSAALNSVGTRSYSSASDWAADIAAGKQSGWQGGPISKDKYNSLSATGKSNYDKYAEITGAASHKATRTSVSKPDTTTNIRTQTGLTQQEARSIAKQKAEKADAARARYTNETAFTPTWASGNASAREKGIAGMRGDGFESSGRAGAEAASRDLGVGMARSGKAKGGVATKKMKRGGLASKK